MLLSSFVKEERKYRLRDVCKKKKIWGYIILIKVDLIFDEFFYLSGRFFLILWKVFLKEIMVILLGYRLWLCNFVLIVLLNFFYDLLYLVFLIFLLVRFNDVIFWRKNEDLERESDLFKLYS